MLSEISKTTKHSLSSSSLTPSMNLQQVGLTQSNIDLIISSTRHTIYDDFFNLLNKYNKGDIHNRDDLLLKVNTICNDLNKFSIKEQLDKWENAKQNFILKEEDKLKEETKQYDDNDDDEVWNELINYPKKMKLKSSQLLLKPTSNIKNRFLDSFNNIENINTKIELISNQLEKILSIVDYMNEKNEMKEDQSSSSSSILLQKEEQEQEQQIEQTIDSSNKEVGQEVVLIIDNGSLYNNDQKQQQ